MGRFIIKADDWYFEWSTIVDAPVTYGMRRDEFETHYRDEYGQEGMRELPRRMARVDEKGTSAFDYESAEDTVSVNRAGFRETELTLAEIVQIYCVEQRSPRDGEGREHVHDKAE